MSLPTLAEAVKRYREARFLNHKRVLGDSLSDFDLEVSCLLRVPFGNHMKGEFCLSVMEMQWPGLLYLYKDGVENYWFTRGIRTMCRHKKNYLVGSASAGKSFMLGAFVYTMWKTSPWNSSVMLSSTDKQALDQKIWGTVKDLFDKDKFKVGIRLDYRECIVLKEDKSNKERDYRDSIMALAIPKGSEGEKAIGSIQGRKNDFVYWGPQPLSAKVLTPIGWKRFGDLYEGDELIDSGGFTQLVTKIHKTTRKASIYELLFSDGSKARSTLTHRWAFESIRRVRYIAPLKYFAASLNRAAPDSKGRPVKRWRLPASPVVHYRQKHPLNVSPYIIGALIGDGSILVGPSYYCAEADLVETFRTELPPDHTLQFVRFYKGCGQYYVKGKNRVNLVTSTLRRIGLFGKGCRDKFIPEEYLRSSIENRVFLLQGLLDTDGCVTGSTIRYDTVSHRLSYDMVELVRSLGGYADESVVDSEYGKRFTVVISLPSLNGIQAFRSVRKLGRCAGYSRTESRDRRLVSVTEVAWEHARCISVSSPDGLYITGDFVLTHNSDEYAHMEGAPIQEGRRNLMANPFFWFGACSNKPNEGDPMYLEAVPDPAKFPQGWETPGLDQLKSWPTANGGICLYFDGEKSPNLQVDGPPPFPRITTREYIESIIQEENGTDGPSYWRWIRAFPKKGDIQDKVLTSELLVSYGATEEVIWRGDGWATLSGLDLGFRKDGDPSVADFGRLGLNHEGRTVLAHERDTVVLVPKMSDPGPHEEKIARRFLEECKTRKCHSVALDISGDGGITALAIRKIADEMEWEMEIIPVSFSNQASEDIYDIAGQKKEGRQAFDRRVSELWYSLRLIVQDRSLRGMVLNSKAVNELCQRRVIQDEKRRWVVEKKEDMKKRMKRSPDNGDARVLLVYNARKKGLSKATEKIAAVTIGTAESVNRSAYSQDYGKRRAYASR